MKWTDKQSEAIYENNKDILVSASAGSGKTAVLSERIVELVKNERIDIDKFVVVTFTKLAANEMKQRILDKLEKVKEANENDSFYERQTILVEKAEISTLHSFGLGLIRDYFYQLDVEPNFGMIDDVENTIMKIDILEALFNKYYCEKNQVFADLVKMYGGIKDDEGLKKQILKLADFALNLPNSIESLRNAISIYNTRYTLEDTEFYKYVIKDMKITLVDALKKLEEVQAYSITIDSDIENIKRIYNALDKGYECIKNVFDSLVFDRVKFEKDTDKDTKDEVNNARGNIKDICNHYKKAFFVYTDEQIVTITNEISKYIIMLEKIVEEYLEIFACKKREKNVIDFNDIEHMTLKLLRNQSGEITPLAREIRKKYRYVIVDEYQDINELQEAILKCISTYNSEVPNMFMVGDVKQSVYRFRKADPEIFSTKYNSFSYDKNDKHYKIDLNQNFRSRKEVLEATNFIFERIMTQKIGDIDYDDNMKLVYGNLYNDEKNQDYKADMYILESKGKTLNEDENGDDATSEVSEELEEMDKYEKEAILMISKINEYMKMKFQVYDMKKGIYRNIEFRDFTILLRSIGNTGFVFQKMLTNAGIPVVLTKQEGIVNTMEVQFILSVLNIIDNPYQDIPILTVLYSSVFNFSIQELLDLKRKFNYQYMYETLERARESAEVEESIKAKINYFMDMYNTWFEYSTTENIVDLIKRVYDDTLYYDYMFCFDNAKERQNNLFGFIEVAKGFENANGSCIYDFLRNIENRVMAEDEIAISREEAIDNAVSIMTIHKSKGLEFPVVFLPALSKEFNVADLKEKILTDKKYGIASIYINPEKYYRKQTFFSEVMKDKISMENLAEEMRILYVALTRAKEKLILIGHTRDIEKSMTKWSYAIKNSNETDYWYLKKARNYLDIIAPSLMLEESKINFNLFIKPEINQPDTNIHLSNVKDFIIDFKDSTEENLISKNDLKTLDYRYDALTKIKEKISVTELKKELQGKEDELFIRKVKEIKVDTDNDSKLTGAQRGTIVHKLMKIINDNTSIDNQFEELIAKKTFKREELEEIDKDKLTKYVVSDIYKRIERSPYVRRELPFMMKKMASEIYAGVESDDFVIIQGIIDCIFEENGQIVVLDYKTDKINVRSVEAKTKRIDELINNYEVQLNLYEEAVKDITGKDVKEKILYLFDIDEIAKIR